MKKLLLLAPLAFLAVPMAAPSASAETVVIQERSHVDNGLHRGWRIGGGQGVRKAVVLREIASHRRTRVTNKVTHTNANGVRVTRVSRQIN